MKAIIFDCDGVLVNSELITAKVLSECLSCIGLDLSVNYIMANYIGKPTTTWANNVEKLIGHSLPNYFLKNFFNKRAERFATELEPVKGAEKCLSVFKDKGYLLAVATQASSIKAIENLKITKLYDYFNKHIYSSTMVTNGKPFPDLFLLAAKELSVHPSDCAAIDDRPEGILGAQAAGMYTFGFSLDSTHVKIDNLGVHIVKNLLDLPLAIAQIEELKA